MIKFLSSALMWALGLFAFFGEAFLAVPQSNVPQSNAPQETYEACIVFKKDSCMCDHDTPLLAIDTLKYLSEHQWFARHHKDGRGRFFIAAKPNDQ